MAPNNECALHKDTVYILIPVACRVLWLNIPQRKWKTVYTNKTKTNFTLWTTEYIFTVFFVFFLF